MGKGKGAGEGQGEGAGRYTICPTPGAAWETAKEWGNKILSMICCCLCTGPILTLIGIIFVISAIKDTRGNNIKKFNTGVASWTATNRPIWAARSFNYAGRTAGTGNSTNAVNVSMIALPSDPINPPTDAKVTTYMPLVYSSGSTAAPTAFPLSGPVNVPVGGGPAYPVNLLSGGVTVAPDTSVSPLFVRTLSTGTTGASSGGTKNPPSPPPPPTPPQYQQYYVSTYCFMVDNVAATYAGSRGCFAFSPSSSFANGQWETKTCSATIFNDANQAASFTNCFTWADFKIQLRSSEDPLVLGFKNGACGLSPRNGCSFGLSRAAKLTIAFVLLFVGICWTCCVYGGLYAIVLHFHNKK